MTVWMEQGCGQCLCAFVSLTLEHHICPDPSFRSRGTVSFGVQPGHGGALFS